MRLWLVLMDDTLYSVTVDYYYYLSVILDSEKSVPHVMNVWMLKILVYQEQVRAHTLQASLLERSVGVAEQT